MGAFFGCLFLALVLEGCTNRIVAAIDRHTESQYDETETAD